MNIYAIHHSKHFIENLKNIYPTHLEMCSCKKKKKCFEEEVIAYTVKTCFAQFVKQLILKGKNNNSNFKNECIFLKHQESRKTITT